MGIEYFHGNVKHYFKTVHISEYRGQRVGVDVSSWMHRAASARGYEILFPENNAINSVQDPCWVVYALKLIETMHYHGVEPVVRIFALLSSTRQPGEESSLRPPTASHPPPLTSHPSPFTCMQLVFDGQANPAKSETNIKRSKKRNEALERARLHHKNGEWHEASRAANMAVKVTPEMAQHLIHRLRENNIEFIVAPFEADSQLAFLMTLPRHQGGISAIITEDSDFVAYGTCNDLLFKFTTSSEGEGQRLRLEDAFAHPLPPFQPSQPPAQPEPSQPSQAPSKQQQRNQYQKKDVRLSFHAWNWDMVLTMAILSGCDYHASLPGMGVKTVHKMVAQHRTLEATLKAMKAHTRFGPFCTPAYEQGIQKSWESFKYALVYHPTQQKCVRLNPVPEEILARPVKERAHIGVELGSLEVARGIADGTIHPRTYTAFPALQLPPQARPVLPLQRGERGQPTAPWAAVPEQKKNNDGGATITRHPTSIYFNGSGSADGDFMSMYVGTSGSGRGSQQPSIESGGVAAVYRSGSGNTNTTTNNCTSNNPFARLRQQQQQQMRPQTNVESPLKVNTTLILDAGRGEGERSSGGDAPQAWNGKRKIPAVPSMNRKAPPGAQQRQKTKMEKEREAAAANCVRISTFFKPVPSKQQ